MSLTLKDLKFNIDAYTFLSKIHFFSFQAYRTRDPKSRKESIVLKEQSSKWRLAIQKMWTVLFCLYTIYVSFSLTRIIMYPSPSHKSYFVPFTITVVTTQILFLYSNCMTSFKWPDINLQILRELITQLENINLNNGSSSVHRLRDAHKETSFMKLLLTFLPFNIFGIELVVLPLVYLYDPNFPAFIYFILSEFGVVVDGENLDWIWLKWPCHLVDLMLFFPVVATAFHAIFVVLSVIYFLNSKTDVIMSLVLLLGQNRNVLNQEVLMEKLGVICKDIRNMELLTSYFNLSFSNIICLIKWDFMVCAIICGFVGIRVSESNPTIAMATAFLAVESNILFVIMFDKASDFPEQVKVVKGKLSMLSYGLAKKNERELMRTTINSLNIKGIKIGEFATFERVSTLNFANFVLNQIVALLLM